MKVLSYIPEIAFLALVVLAVVIRMPIAIFAAAAVLIYLLSFVFGRFFEERNTARLDSDREQSFSFRVTGESLAFTGDFNFRDVTIVPVPNGRIDVKLSMSEDNDRIVGVKLLHRNPGAIKCEKSFIVPVDYGLLYISDGNVVSDAELQKVVRRVASGKLSIPTAEVLRQSSREFGIVVQPDYGNGEYEFRVIDGTIVAKFE